MCVCVSDQLENKEGEVGSKDSTQKRKGNEYCPIANWLIAEHSTKRLDVHCNSIFIVERDVW